MEGFHVKWLVSDNVVVETCRQRPIVAENCDLFRVIHSVNRREVCMVLILELHLLILFSYVSNYDIAIT